MVTHCQSAFARKLAMLPLDASAWKALLHEQPEVCPRDCNYACRDVCREYATVQWRCAHRRAEK